MHLSSKWGNMAMLIGGFGVGQGAIFIMQTWLVAQQQLAFLGLFGLHITFAVLGFHIIDMGALTVLARRIASDDAAEVPWNIFWAITAARLFMALIVSSSALAYVHFFSSPFSAGYIVGVLPGLIVWSVNGAGLLDGLRKSGFSGLAGSLPYLASALVAPFCLALPAYQAALYLGLAFSVGLIAATMLIALILRLNGHVIEWVRPDLRAVRQAFGQGIAMLANWLPGQVFYRVQIVLCGIFLGPAGTGLFVYAKQIINALSQLVAFIRRIEFPNLVERLSHNKGSFFHQTFSALRVGLAAAALSTLGLLAVSVGAKQFLPDQFHAIAKAVALFSPLVLFGAVYLTFSQGLLARGRYGLVARNANIMVIIGIIFSCSLPNIFGFNGFVIAEIVMSLFGSALMMHTYSVLGRRTD